MINEKLLKRQKLIQVDALKMLRVHFEIQRVYFSNDCWIGELFQESIDPCTTTISIITTMTYCFPLASCTSRLLSFSSIGLAITSIIGAFLCVFECVNEVFPVLNDEVTNEMQKWELEWELERELDCYGIPLNTRHTIDTTPDPSQPVIVFNILGLIMSKRIACGHDSSAGLPSTIVVIAELIQPKYDFDGGSLSSIDHVQQPCVLLSHVWIGWETI